MSKSLNIAIIGIRGIPARYGGFEVTAENVALKLVQRGHSVTVYCRGRAKGKPNEYHGIKLKYLPSLELPHLSTPSHTFISAISIIGKKFDVIFGFNVGNALIFWLLKLFGKKTVLFVDGLDWKREKYGPFGRWFLKRSEAIAIHAAKHIVVDAIPAQKHYAEKYGYHAHYIPSGANVVESVPRTGILERLGLTPKKYALSVGRLTPEKRQHLIAKAFKRVKTDYKMVIVGGNKYNPQYVRKVFDEAKDDDRIICTGPLYGADVDELYFNAAVFVNASKVEGTSISLLQAMGSGCALLVSDIPENVSATMGAALIFDHEDLNDFVEKFQEILSNENLMRSLSQKARDVIRNHYSWDVTADKFEKLLLDAAGVEKLEESIESTIAETS